MSTEAENFLKFEVVDHIATLTFNRPEKLNAFTYDMLERWVELIDDCARRDDVRVVVITGTGRAFTTGGDVDHFARHASYTAAGIRHEVDVVQRLPRAIARCEKPVIAALNGLAVGGGLDIALACDIRYAAAEAKLAETYVTMGLLPGLGGGYFLPRLVGLGRALELLWTGEFITGTEAAEIGMVNRAVPADMLMAEVMALARRIADQPPLSVRAIKRITYASLGKDQETALELAAANLPIVRMSADHREAIQAFKEKRKPSFTGA